MKLTPLRHSNHGYLDEDGQLHWLPKDRATLKRRRENKNARKVKHDQRRVG